MAKRNQVKMAVVLSYLQMGLGMLVSIIYTPFMLKLLGQSEYGLYNIASSTIAYLNLLTFGLGSTYIKFYFQYKKNDNKNKINSLNGLFISIFSVLGLVAFIAGMILSMNTRMLFADGLTITELNITSVLMRLMSINLAISFPASVFISFITVHEEFVFQKTVNMFKTVLTPVITIIVLYFGYKSIAMTIVATLISIVTDIINVWFCIKKLNMRFSFKNIEWRAIKEIFGFSIFIVINMIVDEINWNVDKFLLGRFQGSVATSIYGIASVLNGYFKNVSSAITNVFIPRVHIIANGENARNKLTELMAKIGRLQLLILSIAYIGFIFFGKRFILFWAGGDYSESYYIALLLMGPVVIPLTQSVGIEIQRTWNMHRFRSIAYLFMAILNVLISIPLCKIFGSIGCAIGTALSILVANGFIMNIYYQKKMRLNMLYFWKELFKLFPSFIPPVILGVVLSQFTIKCSLVVYFIFIVIYMIVFIMSWWMLGKNEYEKTLAKSLLDAIRKVVQHESV